MGYDLKGFGCRLLVHVAGFLSVCLQCPLPTAEMTAGLLKTSIQGQALTLVKNVCSKGE